MTVHTLLSQWTHNIGKYPTKWVNLARKCGTLPSILDKTAFHQVLVLPRKDERVFPSTLSVSLNGERVGGIFAEIVVRFINSLSPPHRLLPHLTDAFDHAACSHRDNEALDTEKLTTSWSAKARDLYTSKCREATDPTATGRGPDSQARRFSGKMCHLATLERFHQAKEHGFSLFLPHYRTSAEAHSQGFRGFHRSRKIRSTTAVFLLSRCALHLPPGRAVLPNPHGTSGRQMEWLADGKPVKLFHIDTCLPG